jgi:hypothetical protein
MNRKTAREVLEAIDATEIHDWLWTASIKELRDFLRVVKREEHWGIHARDALDIHIAMWVFRLTWIAIACGLIQAFGVVWTICHTH